MAVTVAGICRLPARELQRSKARSPMVSRLDGRGAERSEAQWLKASGPIQTTVAGIDTLSRASQNAKADAMPVTE